MAKLLTTTEVRDIMRKHGKSLLYTNKTSGCKTAARRVKCYYNFEKDKALVAALIAATGVDNVSYRFNNSWYCRGDSLIVSCELG